MLERDGGVFGCELPSGHEGPHALGTIYSVRPRVERVHAQREMLEQLQLQQEILQQVHRRQQQRPLQKAHRRKQAPQESLQPPPSQQQQGQQGQQGQQQQQQQGQGQERQQQRQNTPLRKERRSPSSSTAAASSAPARTALRSVLPPARPRKPPADGAPAAALQKPELSAQDAWLQLEVALERGADVGEVERLYVLIQREGERLAAMSYEQLLADRAEFLAEQPKHPSGEQWGNDWTPELARALRNAPVRRRHEVSGHSMLTCGKVVGCTDHFFQIVYENTHFELRAWHDLRMLLVPHPALEMTLRELMGYLSRTTRRLKKKRDLDEECEQYLPREGCHYSLPVGKVACHLHEELRMSGLVPYDSGPALSD
jgi:hypothetical protein